MFVLKNILINLGLTIFAALVSFGQKLLIENTPLFPRRESGADPLLILAIFTVAYFALGFWISDTQDARSRRKEKNWSGKLDEKVVESKANIRAIFWGSSLFTLIIYVITVLATSSF